MVKTQVNARSTYKSYKGLSDNPMPIKDYLTIGEDYRKFLMDKVLQGHEVVLPARMGIVSIVGTKRPIRYNEEGQPILPPDWKRTKTLWDRNPEAKAQRKIVYCTNESTSGIIYKFLWTKSSFAITNKTLYAIRFTRDNKRRVHDAVVKDGMEYYVKNR